MAPAITLLTTQPLGPGWPVIETWQVTDEDLIDGVELRSITRPDHYVLAHRATSGAARWQATWFDADGPGGDLRRATLEEAISDQAPPTQYTLTAIHRKGERMTTTQNPRVEAQAVRWLELAEYILRMWKGGYPVDSAAAFAPWPEGTLLLSDYLAAVKTLRVPERYAVRVWEEATFLVQGRQDDFVENPAPAPVAARGAIDKFREFHRKEPRRIGQFAPSFAIPATVLEVGAAQHVLYRTDKVDPETLEQPGRPINYIHDHDPGVSVYEPCTARTAAAEDVPGWIRDAEALVLLGTCLGFAFRPAGGGELVEARVRAPRPQLYTTPCGRALLVIQSRREVLAMMWGGSLGVEDRGIVG
jgi:hypothetical protein